MPQRGQSGAAPSGVQPEIRIRRARRAHHDIADMGGWPRRLPNLIAKAGLIVDRDRCVIEGNASAKAAPVPHNVNGWRNAGLGWSYKISDLQAYDADR